MSKCLLAHELKWLADKVIDNFDGQKINKALNYGWIC